MSVFPGSPDVGLTNSELRASPVPVVISGGSGGGGLTNSELRATPVPVKTESATSSSVSTFKIGRAHV